jgi:hypothetical protein
MTRRDRERTAVRELRDALGLTRPQFAELVTGLGYKISGSAIETYEKEVPVEVLRLLAKIAVEKGWPQIAESLQPTESQGPIPTFSQPATPKLPGGHFPNNSATISLPEFPEIINLLREILQVVQKNGTNIKLQAKLFTGNPRGIRKALIALAAVEDTQKTIVPPRPKSQPKTGGAPGKAS